MLDKSELQAENLLVVNYETKLLTFKNVSNEWVNIVLISEVTDEIVESREYTSCCDYIFIDFSDLPTGGYKMFYVFKDSRKNFTAVAINMNYKPTMIPKNRRKQVPKNIPVDNELLPSPPDVKEVLEVENLTKI
jgi:hypothetical protein